MTLRAGKIVQLVKVLAAKSTDLNLIPSISVVDRER